MKYTDLRYQGPSLDKVGHEINYKGKKNLRKNLNYCAILNV